MGDEPMTRADAAVLLAYSQAIHRAITEQRRRQAAVALAVTLLFGALAVWAGLQWSSTRQAVAEVPDDPLIEVLGVRIPDPRPAVQRTELRVRALLWGAGAAGATTIALLAAAAYLLVRPSPLPKGLAEYDDAGQPPMYDISTRSPPDAEDRSSE